MGKRVVASGYFDPLHAGHVEYLELARQLGDELVVIVNNDAQARLKSGVVLLPQEARMAVVAALRCVDRVVLSVDTDATVCRTLESLQPHIFAKGGDRFAGEIPEAAVCRRIGAKIVDGLGAKKDNSSRVRAMRTGVVPVPPEERLVVPKKWGRELWVANNDKYCGKFLEIRAGQHTSWHMHRVKDEVIYAHRGTLTVLHRSPAGGQGKWEEHETTLPQGDCVRVFPQTRHRLWAKGGDVELIEFSTRHVEEDTVREGDAGW